MFTFFSAEDYRFKNRRGAEGTEARKEIVRRLASRRTKNNNAEQEIILAL